MEKHTGHLVHVDRLPEDSVPVTEYNNHKFNNLYYSGSNNKLYQQYRKRIREIPLVNAEHGKPLKILARSDKGQTIYISLKKLKKLLENVNANTDTAPGEPSEDEPLIMDPPSKKSDAKVDFVKGQNMRSQTGLIVDAKAALNKSTAAKRGRRSGKVNVTVDDMKL